MSIIESLSQPIWQRLGLTLVHFLWQGLTVVLLVGMFVRLFRLHSGNSRHAAYLLSFIVMMACPVVTFIAMDITVESYTEPFVTEAESVDLFSATPQAVLPPNDILPDVDISFTMTSKPAATTDSIPLHDRISDYLNMSLPWLLVIWMVGVLILSVRLVIGFFGVYRWCHHLEQPPEWLRQGIVSLSEGLGMQGFSRVFVSQAVLQVMAVGYLRPMVLLPAALIIQMQPEMLEAIIAHELAHIRRFDLWINLLQRIAETLFFYHPAVWWLSNRLRNERELCCDELAVRATGERLTYVSALENASRIRLIGKQPGLAVGLGQDNQPILNRVRHVLDIVPTPRSSRFWLAGIITFLFLAALTLLTATALTAKAKQKAGVQVEDDIIIATVQDKESSANNIPTVLPTVAKSPTPPDKDKAQVQVYCLIAEVPLDLKMDRETTIMAENILGNKMPLHGTKVEVLLRAVEATAISGAASIQNKRVTEQEFNALVEMLTSKGDMKILISPRIQVVDGQTAIVKSDLDSIQITPHVFEDGHIILEVEADISSQTISESKEQTPITSKREISTRQVHINQGESLIIGRMKKNEEYAVSRGVPILKDIPLIGILFSSEDTEQRAVETIFILIPTIVDTASKSQKITDVQVKVEKHKEEISGFIEDKNGNPIAVGVAFPQTQPAKPEAANRRQVKPTKSLHKAAAANDIGQVKSLISKGADVNAKNNQGNRPLHQAILAGHSDMSELLIAKGADINVKNNNGETPLHYAARYRYISIDIAELLLAKGANIHARDRYGRTPLHYAARYWGNDITELLIARGADVNAKDKDGETPLDAAAMADSKNLAKLLIANGANVYTLHSAAYIGDLAKVKSLIKEGADVNAKNSERRTSLQVAAEAGHNSVAELLVAKGADVNARGVGDWTPMHCAAWHGHMDVVELLIAKGADVNAKNKRGDRPLHVAAEAGHKDVTELLIAKGADVNAKNNLRWTPLYYAINLHRGDVVTMLLAQGADVNATNKWGETPLHFVAKRSQADVAVAELLLTKGADINVENNNGETPLHYAAERGLKAIVELVTAKGAHINAKNTNANMPLHYAAYQGYKDVAELLLDKGADVNARNEWGWTPLHRGVTQGHKDVVELLIAKGADVNQKDNQDRSPLWWAKNIGHDEIVELLRKHGAKE